MQLDECFGMHKEQGNRIVIFYFLGWLKETARLSMFDIILGVSNSCNEL